MPLGTPFIPDTIASASRGVIGNLTPAQVVTTYGAGNVKTASKNFVFHYKGHSISFPKGVPIPVDPGLAAALLAANAPVS